jgi:hypothetical protein
VFSARVAAAPEQQRHGGDVGVDVLRSAATSSRWHHGLGVGIPDGVYAARWGCSPGA